jgi:hypothetical protein
VDSRVYNRRAPVDKGDGPAHTVHVRVMRGRLTLLPGLRRLWRDDRTLQLGTDPNTALLLEVNHPALTRVLDMLDGTRTERGTRQSAAELGIPEAAVSDLLVSLRAASLLVSTDELAPSSMPESTRRQLWSESASLALDGAHQSRLVQRLVKPAEALRRRATAAVMISGPARIAAPLAAVLAASGVGHVDTAVTGRTEIADAAVGGIEPADSGRPLRTAVADAVLRAAPEAITTSLREGNASFVVQIGPTAPAEILAYGFARRMLPHLLIEERDNVVLVGPLVPPAGSPCLNCLDLHRRDRDPAWSAVTAQLVTGADGAVPISMATAVTCAGVAAGQVLAYLDGSPVATIGASFEINSSTPPRRRSWTAHPRCDCRSQRLRRVRPSGGSDRLDAGSDRPQRSAVE